MTSGLSSAPPINFPASSRSSVRTRGPLELGAARKLVGDCRAGIADVSIRSEGGRMRKFAWLLLPVALAAGSTGCADREKLNAALAEAKQTAAEKDSLLNAVLETHKFVNDLNAELAQVKSVGVAPVPASEKAASGASQDRTAVLGKIKEVIGRLNESEAKLDSTSARLKRSSSRNSRLLAQLESAKQTVADLKAAAERREQGYTATIEHEKTTITSPQN